MPAMRPIATLLILVPSLALAQVKAHRLAAGLTSNGFDFRTQGDLTTVGLGVGALGYYALTDMFQLGGNIDFTVNSSTISVGKVSSTSTTTAFVFRPALKVNFMPNQKLNFWAGALAGFVAGNTSAFDVEIRGGVEYFLSPDWAVTAYPDLDINVPFQGPTGIGLGIHYGLLVYFQ